MATPVSSSCLKSAFSQQPLSQEELLTDTRIAYCKEHILRAFTQAIEEGALHPHVLPGATITFSEEVSLNLQDKEANYDVRGYIDFETDSPRSFLVRGIVDRISGLYINMSIFYVCEGSLEIIDSNLFFELIDSEIFHDRCLMIREMFEEGIVFIYIKSQEIPYNDLEKEESEEKMVTQKWTFVSGDNQCSVRITLLERDGVVTPVVGAFQETAV